MSGTAGDGVADSLSWRRLDAGEAGLWLAWSDLATPQIVHLGAVLEEAPAALLQRPEPASLVAAPAAIPLFPDPALGWAGVPGWQGPEAARPWRWQVRDAGADAVEVIYRHPAGAVVTVGLAVFAPGLFELSLRAGPAAGRLCHTVPLPPDAAEQLAFGGRWAGELAVRRVPLAGGGFRTSRAGARTAHDAFPGQVVGEAGFGEDAGAVLGLHLAWFGNYDWHVAERRDGGFVAQVSLDAAEVDRDGDDAVLPPLYLGWSPAGLNGLRRVFQDGARRLRSRPPAARVQLNTWEGIYFDHDPDRLAAIAEAAADLGVERFVLDDGWFGRRRDDRRGLGDWTPRPDAYPDGLGPLMDRVRHLGMEFGLWVEPEMVNRDSALFEAHPDWVLGEPDQPLGRHQFALDLGRPACLDHVAGVLETLVADRRIAALKWDMNRDVPQGAGRPLVPAATALFDRVRAARPDLDIEACASGGGRADWRALSRTQRVWLSDAHDPDLRLPMMAAYGLFAPPEVMGSHVGPEVSHQTGRRWSLHARAAMAVLGSMGLELDPTTLAAAERDTVRACVTLHKRVRSWLHDGHLLVLPHPDPALTAVGVFARDHCRALVCVLRRSPAASAVTAPLRIRHVSGTLQVRVPLLDPAVRRGAPAQPPWIDMPEGLRMTDAELRAVGVPLPALPPGRALLIELSPAAASRSDG